MLIASLPFFALVLAGWAAGRFGVLDAGAANGVNRYVYFFALPAFLFLHMAGAAPGDVFNGVFFVAYLAGGLATFALSAVLARPLMGGSREGAVFGLAACYGNIGFLAIPLLTATIGPQLAVPLAVVLTLDLVVLVPFGLFVIEMGRGGGGVVARVRGAVVRVVFTNPLIIAIAAGLAAAGAGLTLPEPVRVFADLLGRTAGPCALFALGATLAGRPVSHGLGVAAALSVAKLVLHPVIMGLAMVILAVPAPWSTAAVLAAAMPVAAVLFVLAQQYDVAPTEASTGVLLSTGLAVGTVPLAVWVMSRWGLFGLP